MLKVSVISPEAVLFEGETDAVVAPAYDGEIGILTTQSHTATGRIVSTRYAMQIGDSVEAR